MSLRLRRLEAPAPPVKGAKLLTDADTTFLANASLDDTHHRLGVLFLQLVDLPRVIGLELPDSRFQTAYDRLLTLRCRRVVYHRPSSRSCHVSPSLCCPPSACLAQSCIPKCNDGKIQVWTLREGWPMADVVARG
eukprot:7267283-Prymnesium_polylepis.1